MTVKDLLEKFFLWHEGKLPIGKMEIYIGKRKEKLELISVGETEHEIFAIINPPKKG